MRKPTNRLTCLLLLSELKLEERVQIQIRLVFLITKKEDPLLWEQTVLQFSQSSKSTSPPEITRRCNGWLAGWLVGSLFDDAF
jgi:hypothetical protein